MPANDPTPEEVAAEVRAVWVQVVEIAAMPGGKRLMKAAAETYPKHDD